MKVGSFNTNAPATPATNETVRTEKPAATPASPAPSAPSASSASATKALGSQPSAVQAAQSELARKDEIDHARVAEIRAALERGEITFDAAKLARLIERHHGGRG